MTLPHRSIEHHRRSPDSATLVKRIANGDESAFATLYDTTCGFIYGLLLRMLGNSAAAEEVMEAVYQEVWEQAAAADERENTMTWLITIAHSRASVLLRADKHSQSHQASLELTGHPITAKSETVEIISEEQKFVQSALAELSPVQQQIIKLAYFSGLRQNEIATLLSLSLQSVQAGMRAAMRKIRDSDFFRPTQGEATRLAPSTNFNYQDSRRVVS